MSKSCMMLEKKITLSIKCERAVRNILYRREFYRNGGCRWGGRARCILAGVACAVTYKAPDTKDPRLADEVLVSTNYIKAHVEPMRYSSFNNATEHISIVQQHVRRKKVQGSQLRTVAAPPSVHGHRSRPTLQTGSEHRLIPHEHFPFW